MKTRIEIVTPEKARIYLAKNKKNRALKPKIVNNYANQMLRGQWQLTGQGISFNENGELIDGQHRLMAVIKSNTNIETLIIEDVSENSFSVYDTGKLRSPGDIFGISGITNANNKAAGIASYFTFKNNTGSERRIRDFGMSKTDLLNKYYEMPELWDVLCASADKYVKKLKIFNKSVLMGWMAYQVIDKEKPMDVVYNFLNQVFGFNNDSYICTKTLREQIIRVELGTKKYSLDTKIEKLTKTFDYWQRGLNNKKLY